MEWRDDSIPTETLCFSGGDYVGFCIHEQDSVLESRRFCWRCVVFVILKYDTKFVEYHHYVII